MDSSVTKQLQLADVTMMEVINALRGAGFFLQFEREVLSDQNTNWSRPVVDSCRRFNVILTLNWSVPTLLTTLTGRDPTYDWVQLTQDPASYWIFPCSKQEDRFAASAMAWKVGLISGGGRLSLELVCRDLGLQDHQITVFDRAGLLNQISVAPVIKTEGRPLYEVLGDLFARSGKPITWTLGGLGDARVLSIGILSLYREAFTL